ncbi:MAG: bifunctional riboflavin kinase/FAD synthetase [Gammaproteobacteria bacterium]|nr:bifunctional riboflavin kinase/FAD synthetase [Gammaproteobacteria bacterium]
MLELIRGLHNIRPSHRGCVVTIGTFDGIHHGHQMLIHHLCAKSIELQVPSLLVTFEPTPTEYFRGEAVPARLTRFREKFRLLEETELDRVMCIPFNERTRSISADEVIEQFLVELLDVQYLVVGDDFRFGKNAEGDYAMLKTAGDKYHFGVSHMGTLQFEHERISSTRIRQALHEGDFTLAEKLLGRPYFMMGPVVEGQHLGTKLGTPTANIRLQRYKSALEGVFAVVVEGEGFDKPYEGSAYVGTRPTIDGVEPLLEVHLFDFSDDIYGKRLKVSFLEQFRGDVKFESMDELRHQIQLDLENTRSWFAENRHLHKLLRKVN